MLGLKPFKTNCFMNELINLDGENDGILTFEDFKNENGIIYWWASDLAKMLGYVSLKSFEAVLGRATSCFFGSAFIVIK